VEPAVSRETLPGHATLALVDDVFERLLSSSTTPSTRLSVGRIVVQHAVHQIRIAAQ
jgi:hypothetical protein